MLRVRQNEEEIIIRTVPVKEWIIGSILGFILVSVISLWLYYGAVSSGSVWLVFFSVFLGGYLIIFLINKATTIKINKPGKTISIRKQNFIKYSFEIYSFDEIADFIYIDSKLGGRKGNETVSYQTFLPLKDGNRLELSISSGFNDNEYFEIVDKMNSYIFDTSKQIPFKLTIFNDD
jgi:hypothetical protein